MAKVVTATLTCPAFYDLNATTHAHGWKYLAPFSWEDDTGTLRFAAAMDETAVDIDCRQVKSRIKIRITSHGTLSSNQLKRVKESIQRSLCLDVETQGLLEKAEKVDLKYANLVRKGAGRMLRSPTLWEDAAKTLFTTNCSWALTKKMCESMCADRFAPVSPSGIYPFPLPQRIAAYSTKQLKTLVRVGYRAEYLKALAEAFSIDPYLGNLETDGYDYRAADSLVRRLKGFADYACAHLLVLAGYYDNIPVDSTVVSFLKENYRVRKPHSFVVRHYRKWGSDRWWGYKLERMVAKQNWIGD